MIGALSGVPGRRPAMCSSISSSSDAGHQLVGVAQQLVHAAGGDGGVEAALLRGRAEDVAPVAARHEVAGVGLAPAHDALQEPRAGRVAQAQRLALDRAHARLVAEGAPTTARRRPRPARRAAPASSSTSTPGRSTAPALLRAARASGLADAARIDGVVIGDVQRAAQRRRQRGLQAARGAGQQPLHAQPEALAQLALALERLGVVAVAGEHQRAARPIAEVDPADLPQLRARRPASAPRCAARARAAAARRRRSRRPARACRRPRARCPRPARRVEHDDRQPAQPGAPGHARGRRCRRRRRLRRSCRCLSLGECRVLSLRRHDPDQLLTVGGRGAALSAQTKRAPVDHRW